MYVFFLLNTVILKLKSPIKKDERVDNRQYSKLQMKNTKLEPSKNGPLKQLEVG